MIGGTSLSARTDEVQVTAAGSRVPLGRELSLECSECGKWKNLSRSFKVFGGSVFGENESASC